MINVEGEFLESDKIKMALFHSPNQCQQFQFHHRHSGSWYLIRIAIHIGWASNGSPGVVAKRIQGNFYSCICCVKARGTTRKSLQRFFYGALFWEKQTFFLYLFWQAEFSADRNKKRSFCIEVEFSSLFICSGKFPCTIKCYWLYNTRKESKGNSKSSEREQMVPKPEMHVNAC